MSDVIAAARAERWDDVLEALLASWRLAPNRELADLIVEVGAHRAVAARWEALDGTPHANRVSNLLAHVLDKGSVKARDRVDAIASWPPDPRIDRWVSEQYAEPPTTSTGARPFWTRLLTLAQAIVDTHAANTILKAREGWRDTIPWQAFLAGHVERARAKLVAAKDAPFDATTRATIVAVRAAMREANAAALPARHGDATALLAAALANPDDLAARAVLGDVLLEQGDPRGELISLQLLAEPSAAQQRRAKEIVKLQAMHLLGPLHGVLRKYTFERGFVARASLKVGNARALDNAIEKTVGHPLWATVEHLEGGSHDLVTHPVMRSLRSLASSTARLPSVAQLPRLETYVTTFSGDDWTALAHDPRAFTQLRDLDVFLTVPLAHGLLESPLFARLARLQLRVETSNYDAETTDRAFALLPRVATLGVPDVTLRFVRSRDKDWYCGFRFADGKVESLRSRDMTPGYEELVTQDQVRALEILRSVNAPA